MKVRGMVKGLGLSEAKALKANGILVKPIGRVGHAVALPELDNNGNRIDSKSVSRGREPVNQFMVPDELQGKEGVVFQLLLSERGGYTPPMPESNYNSYASIVCGDNGEKLAAHFTIDTMPPEKRAKSSPCGSHAHFAVPDHVCQVTVREDHMGIQTLKIFRHSLVHSKPGVVKIDVDVVWAGDLEHFLRFKEDNTFFKYMAAVNAATEKAECENCKCSHYVKPRDADKGKKVAKAAESAATKVTAPA